MTTHRKKKEKYVLIFQANLSDEIISELKQAEGDDFLKQALLDYKKELEESGKEVFQVFDYFMVCEDGIYIALYEAEAKRILKGL